MLNYHNYNIISHTRIPFDTDRFRYWIWTRVHHMHACGWVVGWFTRMIWYQRDECARVVKLIILERVAYCGSGHGSFARSSVSADGALSSPSQ